MGEKHIHGCCNDCLLQGTNAAHLPVVLGDMFASSTVGVELLVTYVTWITETRMQNGLKFENREQTTHERVQMLVAKCKQLIT